VFDASQFTVYIVCVTVNVVALAYCAFKFEAVDLYFVYFPANGTRRPPITINPIPIIIRGRMRRKYHEQHIRQ
jgi:hypothetical protein